ncbi:MAG: hypothetical protein KA200_00395 [Burkholderiales bacterium]|nr:hypothetical protein [Burkholderiales bacterium]
MAAALIQASSVKAFKGDSASADAKITLGSAVTATSTLIAYVAAQRLSTATPGLINALSSTIGGSPANTWSIANAAQKISDSGSNHQTESLIAVAMNVSAGTTEVALDFVYEDANTVVSWFVEEWSGLALTSIVNGVADGSCNHEATSTTSASTAGLVTTDDMAFAVLSGMFLAAVNGGSPQTPTSGWTHRGSQLVGTVLDNRAPFHVQSKQLASSSAISVAYTHDIAYQGNAVALATFRSQTVNKRIEITGIDTAVNGTTGWSIRHWLTDTDGSAFRKVEGITAEASGGKIYITGSTVPNVSDGTTVNCVAYRPGASPIKGLVGIVTGTVKDY